MCIACELGFWMAMDEPPPVAVKAKGKPAPSVEGSACDAPEAKPAKRRPTAQRKPRRRAAQSKSERQP